jgi:hypothetical protein
MRDDEAERNVIETVAAAVHEAWRRGLRGLW